MSTFILVLYVNIIIIIIIVHYALLIFCVYVSEGISQCADDGRAA